MKKILIAFALLLSFLLAVACENVEFPEESLGAEDSSENIYEKLESELPPPLAESDGEVKKQEFVIATDDKAVFINEEGASGSINKAVDKRNDFLYDTYGAEIKIKETKSGDLSKELKSALESGLYYCDMISVSAKETVKLMNAGLLADVNTLPGFDAKSEYFDKENATILATNSSLYMLVDPTVQYYEEAYVMLYNRNLVVEAAGQEPETLALQGKWTIDTFHQVAKASASKVYSNMTADIQKDVFGFGAYYSEGVLPLVMWTGAGYKFVAENYKQPVKMALTIEETKAAATPLREAFNSRGRYPFEGEEVAVAFKNDRLAFMVHKFSYFYTLANEKPDKYGFLPIPKLNEDQDDYKCLLSTDARVISVPKTLDNQSEDKKRFVSVVLSATCATGRDAMKNAFINEHIGTYIFNNEETVLLSMLCDSATFDFAHVYGSVIGEIRRPTTDAISDYIEFGSALNTSISRTIGAFNKYSSEKFK